MLANRIAELRKANGMSQSQLACALHISASAEGMYEQGRRTPSLEILIMMSRLFCVSLDYLITGVEYTSLDTISYDIHTGKYTGPKCSCRSCCRCVHFCCRNGFSD